MEEQREADKIVLVYEHLVEDIEYLLPQLKGTFEKDLKYLRRSARERGIPFFVTDLPLLGKHLDRALDEGRYPPSTLAHSYALRHGSKVIPVFLGSLYKLIFAENGCLRDDYEVEAIRALRQIYYLCKKLSQPFSQAALDASVQQLFDEDKLLPKPGWFWSEPRPHWRLASISFPGFSRSRWYWRKLCGLGSTGPLSVCLDNLDIISKVICDALGPYCPSDFRFKHGPGAISQVSRPTNKYSWFGWSDALEFVYPIADCGFHNLSSWADWTSKQAEGEEYSPVSRLVAVPKTYEKPRLIAAEPSEHQWCQQNLWHYFETRTKNSFLGDFIRFRDQSLNQDLCLKGSEDGSLATVDLSSASDRVSCHAVGLFFRHNFGLLKGLRATRTPKLVQKLTKLVPSELDLSKFSTMGSACTFPVESIMFLGIALAAVLANENQAPTLEHIRDLVGKVAVFGDDIIVPRSSRKLLQQALELLDFKVNDSKSFSEGNFRESCGVDCFNGEYVTPVYLRTFATGTPESVSSTVETANNFYSLFFLRTAAYLESTAPSGIATVYAGSGAFGFKSRVGSSFPRKRWNHNLQREEVRMLTIKSTQDVSQNGDDSSLHQYFTERPDPLVEWRSGTRMRSVSSLRYGWFPLYGPLTSGLTDKSP